jgi:hypothetical protein
MGVVGNDRTGAQLPLYGASCVAELGPASMRLKWYHFSTCISHTGLHHSGDWLAPSTATDVAHFFFQANFELHPYSVEK